MRIVKQFIFILLCPLLLFSSAHAASVDTLLYGWGWKDSDREQTPLGCVITDAMRWSTDSDVALFPGSMIRTNLAAGPVEREAIDALFYEPVSLVVVTLDAAAFWVLLEDSVSGTVLNEDETWDKEGSASQQFLQISGFRFEYDLAARYGDRVRFIELEDGRLISSPSSDMTVTAALPSAFAREALPHLEGWNVEGTAADGLEAYIHAVGILTEPTDARIIPWGVATEPWVKTYHLGFVAVACSIVILFFTLRKPREPTWKELLETPSSKGSKGTSESSHKE